MLGPLRVAGYRGSRDTPLLHVKLLVLGTLYWAEDEYSREQQVFRPDVAWWGSANRSPGAEKHIEIGTFSDTGHFLDEAVAFLRVLIVASEPITSSSPRPDPELAPVGFDDDAFHAYVEEYHDLPDDKDSCP